MFFEISTLPSLPSGKGGQGGWVKENFCCRITINNSKIAMVTVAE